MLEFFDHLLFNALVEYNNLINRCAADPAFAYMVDRSGIGDAMERNMHHIVNSAESAGAISMSEWRIIRHTIGMIALDYDDVDNDLLYEVEA